MITETDRLASALDLASKFHPELASNKTDLVREIIDLGIESLEHKARQNAGQRQEAVTRIAGSLPNVWPRESKEERLAEWPS